MLKLQVMSQIKLSLHSPFKSRKLTKLWKLDVSLFVIFSIIILVLLSVEFIFHQKLQQAHQRVMDLDIGNSRIQQEISNYQLKLNRYAKAKKLWKQIHNQFNSKNGLEIEHTYVLLNELSRKYNLTSVPEVKLSPPTIQEYKATNPPLNIMSSTVKMKIFALTDDFILRFTSEFLSKIHGFVKIKKFTLKRINFPNLAIYQEIEKGGKLELVSAEIIFEWQDLINSNNNYEQMFKHH